jgi:hypothetical protein
MDYHVSSCPIGDYPFEKGFTPHDGITPQATIHQGRRLVEFTDVN